MIKKLSIANEINNSDCSLKLQKYHNLCFEILIPIIICLLMALTVALVMMFCRKPHKSPPTASYLEINDRSYTEISEISIRNLSNEQNQENLYAGHEIYEEIIKTVSGISEDFYSEVANTNGGEAEKISGVKESSEYACVN